MTYRGESGRYTPDFHDLMVGGATYRINEDWRDNDGFTLSRATLEAGYQVGFMLSRDMDEGVTTWATTKSEEALESLIWACAQRFKGIVDYVGFWRDDDGLFHVDPSVHFDTLQGALIGGSSFGQLTVWDWAKMDAIVVPQPEVK